ncbi:MAG: hypothetical protein KDC87_09405 [Planctomycetes bacterium]|nr:hypothetical protein [Planctomycetota bacterium]MCB9869552.1 hypothetical protein [Planctomycetota bacterium]
MADPFAAHPTKPVRRLLGATFRGQTFLIATSLIGTLVAAGYALLQPNAFQSHATFRYRQGSESVTPQPTNWDSLRGLDPQIAPNAPQLLKTDALLRQTVARKIRFEAEDGKPVETTVMELLLKPWTPPEVVIRPGAGFAERASGNIRRFILDLQRRVHSRSSAEPTPEAAIEVLGKGLDVYNVPGTGLMRADFEATDPITARVVLEAFAEQAQAYHIDQYRDQATVDLITLNYNTAQQRLSDAKQKLEAFLRNSGTVSFQEDYDSLRDDVRRAAKKLEDSKEEKLTWDLRLEQYRADLEKTPKRVLQKVTVENARIPSLQKRILSLEADRDTLLATMRDTDPAVQQVQKQIDQARRDLEQEYKRPPTERNEFVENDEYKKLQEVVRTAQIQSKVARFNFQDAEQRHDKLKRRLDKMIPFHGPYLGLQEQIQKAQKAADDAKIEFDKLQDKETLRSKNFSALKLAIKPTAAIKSGPQRTKSVLLGLLAGFALGFGILTLRSLTDTTVRTPEEIEALLGVRVLATVPQLDRKNLRRHERRITSGC